MNQNQIKPFLPLSVYFMLVGPIVGLALILICMYVYAIVLSFQNGIRELIELINLTPMLLLFGGPVAFGIVKLID